MSDKPKYILSLTVNCDLAWPYTVAFTRWRKNGQPVSREYTTGPRRLKMVRGAIASVSENGLVKVSMFASIDKCVIEFTRIGG